MNQDLAGSSHHVDEFNRIDEEKGFIHKETSLHKITSWIIYLCPLIFLFLTLILSLVIVGSAHTENYDDTKDALRVLNKGFFGNRLKSLWEEIKVIDALKDDPADTNTPKRKIPNTCEASFAELPIYHWHGVESGCLCNDGKKHWRSYCTVSSSDQNCQTVDEVPSQNFRVWKNKLICVKKYTDANFKFQPQACESSWTSCEQQICVKNANCPISNLVLATSSPRPQNADPNKLRIDSTLEFWVVRDNASPGIVDLRSSISQPPCNDHKLSPKTTSGKSYLYLKSPLKGCGKYEDMTEYSTILDTQTENDFFTQNNIKSNTVPGLFDTFDAGDKVGLYQVTRLPLGSSASCKSLEKHISAIGTSAEDSINAALAISIVILILSIIGLILIVFYILGKNLRCRKRFICQGPGAFYVILIVCLIVIILCIVQAGIYWSYESSIEASEDKEELVASFERGQCITRGRGFEKAIKTIKEYLSMAEIGLFGVIIFLFVWAIFWLVIWIACWVVRKFVLKDLVLRRP